AVAAQGKDSDTRSGQDSRGQPTIAADPEPGREVQVYHARLYAVLLTATTTLPHESLQARYLRDISCPCNDIHHSYSMGMMPCCRSSWMLTTERRRPCLRASAYSLSPWMLAWAPLAPFRSEVSQ